MVMDAEQLSDLIEQRFQTLDELLKLGRLQSEAIEGGRMTELMRVLSQKQEPLNRLTEIAQLLRPAAMDDPGLRVWTSESARLACRRQQEQCDQMHLELLAMEAACESMLQDNRATIQQEIEGLHASHQAAVHYAPNPTLATSGRQLDLRE